MLSEIIDKIMQLDTYKHNTKYADDMKKQVTALFNAGWEGLEDGTVITYRNGQIALKEGNSLKNVKMADVEDYSVVNGKLHGKIGSVLRVMELDESQKQMALSKAIICKFQTIPKF